MQQKVQFITTIVHEPKLLIFDEPFSGFDPINANLIKKEILELKENGATIIFSTHNMGSVEELCDHVALINKSHKILDGSINEIRQQHKSHIFEVAYKGEFQKVEKIMGNQFQLLGHSEKEDYNHVTIKYLNGGSSNDLLKTLIPEIEISSYQELIPSMNDVFISVVENSNNNK